VAIVVSTEINVPVVGQGADMGYHVSIWPDSYDVMASLGPDLGAISMNLALLVVQVEGIDFPFFHRDADIEPPAFLFEPPTVQLRNAEWEAPLMALLETPPDTTPLFTLPGDMTHDYVMLAHLAEIESFGRRVSADDFPMLFPAVTGQPAYDDNVCRVLSEIQRHLLEPTIDSGVTWQLWSEAEVRGCLMERVCGFLLATGITRERISVPVPVGALVVDLPQEIIEIRRVQYRTGSSLVTLLRTDEMQLDNYTIGWDSSSPGSPTAYVENPLPTLQVKLDVPSGNIDGSLEMIVVKRPATLAGCTAFPIPSMFVPYIKWGILADLLRKEGEANDPERSTYCEKRYAEGIDLARALLGVDF
jgi:hypothetical protein